MTEIFDPDSKAAPRNPASAGSPGPHGPVSQQHLSAHFPRPFSEAHLPWGARRRLGGVGCERVAEPPDRGQPPGSASREQDPVTAALVVPVPVCSSAGSDPSPAGTERRSRPGGALVVVGDDAIRRNPWHPRQRALIG